MSLKWKPCQYYRCCITASAGRMKFFIRPGSEEVWLRFSHDDYPGIRYETVEQAKESAEKSVRELIVQMQEALGEEP